MRWHRPFRYLYLRFLRLRGTPHEIALGFAWGVFWGMFPLPGIQMAVAILFAAIFRSSKLAAAAGTWLSNPITTLPLTALNLQVGAFARGQGWISLPDFKEGKDLLGMGGDLILSYVIGCAIVGAIAGTFFYCAGIPIIQSLQQRSTKRRHTRYHNPKSWHPR